MELQQERSEPQTSGPRSAHMSFEPDSKLNETQIKVESEEELDKENRSTNEIRPEKSKYDPIKEDVKQRENQPAQMKNFPKLNVDADCDLDDKAQLSVFEDYSVKLIQQDLDFT